MFSFRFWLARFKSSSKLPFELLSNFKELISELLMLFSLFELGLELDAELSEPLAILLVFESRIVKIVI